VKRFVVFGGSGFIGSHLVKALARRDACEIVVADIRPPQVPLPSCAVYKFCDVRRPIPEHLVDESTTVIDLAAIAREPGYPAQAYYDTNVNGARNISEFCTRTGINTIWFTSTMSVYGTGEEPKPETAAPSPETPYGDSKLRAEHIYQSWLEQDAERRLLIVRPAVIFGAGDHGNFTRLARALKRRLFVYPGRKDTVKACGYVEDLIDSMFFMEAQREKYLLYNFCYPTSYTIEEICEAFAKVAGLPRPWGVLPLPLMLNISKVFKLLDDIGIKNDIHPARIRKLVRSTHIVPGELLKRGYQFQTNLEEGLQKWLMDNPVGEFV
jgi:nucleoside-diphosphate-sugar epimerase